MPKIKMLRSPLIIIHANVKVRDLASFLLFKLGIIAAVGTKRFMCA